MTARRWAVVSVLLAIIAVGCDSRPGPSAPKIDFHKVLDWPWAVDRPTGTAGIDYGALWCAMDRSDTPLVVIWFDGRPAGQQIGRGKWTPQGSENKQPVRFDSGAVVTFEYRTEAGKSGMLDFRIDGKEYDLDAGRLFLVSVRGDATHLVQLQRDIGPEAMPFTTDSVAAIVKNDREIREFFSDATDVSP
jgi:hypothetical protein